MSVEPESFLSRWSRRKREAERESERPSEVAAPQVPAAPAATNAAGQAAAGVPPVPSPASVSDTAATTEMPLPPIESLDGLRSEYEAFFQRPVDEDLRRAALKKLFADPHFNQMDMLDVYVDDYTQFEPLPAALRMRLPSARAFLPDSEREAVEAAEAADAAAAAGEPSAAVAGVEADPVDSGIEEPAAMNDPSVGSTSAPPAALHAIPADTTLPVDPAPAAVVSPAPGIAPGKATASDPSST